MRKAVVTYNFGDYDKVAPILWKSADWDYYLFTDNPALEVDGYKRVVMDEKFFDSEDPKRRANQIKYTPFKTLHEELGEYYDLAIVMDANLEIQGPLDDFVDIYMMSSSDGVFITHPNCDSVYDDLDLCVELSKDDPLILLDTHRYFKEEGYPEKVRNYFQTTLSIRRNSGGWSIVEKVFYDEYKKWSKRDQPMMNFVHWKYPVLDLNVIDITHIGEYIKYENHHFEK